MTHVSPRAATSEKPRRATTPSRSRVRPAVPADMDDLLEFTRKVVPGTRWAADGIDIDKFRRDGARILAGDGGQYCVLLWERSDLPAGERIQGLVFGLVQDFFWSSRRQAVALVYALTPAPRGGSGALKLMTAFRRWAENRGAHELAVSVTSGDRPKETGDMLARMGFRWVGGNYVFDLATARAVSAKQGG